MKLLTSMGIWLSTLLFAISMSLFAFTLTVSMTVGRSEVVKGWLNDSDSYQNIANELANVEIETTTPVGTVSVLTDQAILRAAVADTFTDDILQGWSEDVIDGSFTWLSGETEKPEFTLDVGPAKRDFVGALETQLAEEYNSRPECVTGNQKTLLAKDPLNASCKSSQFDALEYFASIRDDVLASEEFLSREVYTADDLSLPDEINTSSEPYYIQLADAPRGYQLLKIAPFIFLGLGVLFAAIIILLSSNIWVGLKRVSSRLITAGIAGLISVVLLGISLSLLSSGSFNTGEASINSITEPLLEQVIRSLLTWTIIIAASLGGLGVATRLGLRIAGKPEKPSKTDRPNKVDKQLPPSNYIDKLTE